MEGICEYGCDQEASYKMSNGKLCCSSHYNKCPAIRKKNSEGLKKAHKEGRHSAKYFNGKRSWAKGMTWEERYGKQRAKERKEELAKRNEQRFKNMTEEEYEKLGQKIREGLAKSDGNVGGIRSGSNKWRGCHYYNENEDKEVWLDSSWEKKYVEYLDKNDIPWIRNTKKFSYEYEGKERKYIPDFYLPEKDLYIEVKGYEKEIDRVKWDQFPKRIKVLKQEQLENRSII